MVPISWATTKAASTLMKIGIVLKVERTADDVGVHMAGGMY